jgi:flagellar assembly factor FliW
MRNKTKNGEKVSLLSEEVKNNHENIFFFEKGIPGFESYQYYTLMEEGESLAQLFAVDEEKIGFILMRPFGVFPKYEFELDEQSLKELKIVEVEKTNGIETWVILTINHQDFSKTTANLKAPIILNRVEKVGIQVILPDDYYLSRQPLFIEPSEQTSKGAEE